MGFFEGVCKNPQITINSLAAINIEKLDADLRAAFSNSYMGLSTRQGDVIVFMAEDTSNADVLAAEQVVETHDATQLTSEQAAEIAEQQVLADMRTANGDNLDLSQFAGENAALQALANKVAWLELEIRDLRGV
jgi:hypothetical protein